MDLRRICVGLVLGLLVMSAAGPATANWMGNFQLESGPRAFFGLTDRAYITFDFKATDPDGARFIVYGYKDGAAVPGGTYSGSITYPVGTEDTHTNFVGRASTGAVVDQYRIVMWNTTAGTLLEMFLPVDYTWGDHGITNIQLSHTSPSWIMHGSNLDITFDYTTSEAGGVRIMARPFTGGGLTPGYSASGVANSPVGSGSGSQYFRFDTPDGDVDVDEVRFQMWNDDYSQLLLEFFVPVHLYWREVGISNLVFDPPFPECLVHGQKIYTTFDYETDKPEGIKVTTMPRDPTGDLLAGGYYQNVLAVYYGSGTATRYVGAWETAGSADVGALAIFPHNLDGTVIYFRDDYPINYHYDYHAVQNITFRPMWPAVLDNDEYVYVDLEYRTAHDDSVLVFTNPITDGQMSDGWGTSGSARLPPPSGVQESRFRIHTGTGEVDHAQFHMMDDTRTNTLLDFTRVVRYYWGPVGAMLTGVGDAPAARLLAYNFPNPFNPSTTIAFTLARPTTVDLSVYDIAGRLVSSLIDGEFAGEGRHETPWLGRDDRGRNLSSGVYFYRLQAGDEVVTRKMTLVR